ncbi:hypothetical protein IC235_09385 [Hymenobacter sp. BT664]|uniref:Uncharacterized protein n=1 Tax=Hymenobacter montanus TaxID=2771359 RepID=A0A927GJG8_9BACT|nr:hypothetical protein [Hymenobacter montanus]MBD2768101.1 hypothetical protein [Hymenobacter montanus]
MIDTESINSFLESVPEPTREANRILYMQVRPPDENEIASVALAERGYLGCVSFAGAGNDDIIIRLLPGRNIGNSPVAIAWGYVTEGMTIAPDLKRFVAARLAQMDAADPDNFPTQEEQDQLLRFASEFGDVASTASVLQALNGARLIDEYHPRAGALWSAASGDDPLCMSLAATRILRERAIGHWFTKAVYEIPEVDIVWRIYLAYHLREQTGVDVTEAAWRLVMSDNVFDSTYDGYTRGPATANWENEPLVLAVQWLQQQQTLNSGYAQTDLWQAAQLYAANPLGYDGAAHLAVAKKIASDDPILAYTQTANAAAFFARATKETPKEAIVFAHQLAVENGWEDLSTVLEWARTDLEI